MADTLSFELVGGRLDGTIVCQQRPAPSWLLFPKKGQRSVAEVPESDLISPPEVRSERYCLQMRMDGRRVYVHESLLTTKPEARDG